MRNTEKETDDAAYRETAKGQGQHDTQDIEKIPQLRSALPGRRSQGIEEQDEQGEKTKILGVEKARSGSPGCSGPSIPVRQCICPLLRLPFSLFLVLFFLGHKIRFKF